jgi:SnoaL-like domain
VASATEQTVEAFSSWLDEIVARGAWPAERAFIADELAIHGEMGTRRLTRDQYMQWMLSTRPPDWRLTVHDLVAQGDRIGHAFTVSQTDPRTGTSSDRHGIEVARFDDGKFAEIWIAPRSAESGPWPNLGSSRAEWSIVNDPPTPEEATIAAAMVRYGQIRQTREAAGLRDLFVDPMVVHGPGPTRAESLDEFIRRVATELDITPGLTMEPHDCIVAGAKAFYRWSYRHPNPALSNPSPIADLTLYAFRAGKIAERWQAALPGGTGWE